MKKYIKVTNTTSIFQKDPEPIETVLKASNDAIAKWTKHYPSQVTINSPDNPLLGFSESEYLAMK